VPGDTVLRHLSIFGPRIHQERSQRSSGVGLSDRGSKRLWGILEQSRGCSALALLADRPNPANDGDQATDQLGNQCVSSPSFGDNKATTESQEMAYDSKRLRFVHRFLLLGFKRFLNETSATINRTTAVVNRTHASSASTNVIIKPDADANTPVTPFAIVCELLISNRQAVD
jgi:hypothetical protein